MRRIVAKTVDNTVRLVRWIIGEVHPSVVVGLYVGKTRIGAVEGVVIDDTARPDVRPDVESNYQIGALATANIPLN